MFQRALVLAVVVVASVLMVGAKKDSHPANQTIGPFQVVALDGGRRLDFIRTFTSDRDLHPNRSFFSKVVDAIAGPPEWHNLARPYSVITDSRSRLLITDPGIPAVHVFDVEKKKYTMLEGGGGSRFRSPIGIAVDADDNIYVTDSQLGKILVFDSRGKYRRALGALKRGEGFYKRPTGIAIDNAEKKIYVTDTLRDRVYITDMEGTVLKSFGERGDKEGQFNFPTEVRLSGDSVYVVDAMNFRVQAFDRQGNFRAMFGQIGDVSGSMFRPKGISLDSEGNIYVVDASAESVQVFSRIGELLYRFGRSGTRPAEFELPAGVWIDPKDRVYVADSYNHRVQVFQFVTAARGDKGRR
ncbi:MAG: 6-bladed beta-propeller [Acidobacteriaceae bacterium]|nr:6-bladed beta-propeller [Acidobacteriaceae bacterium]